MSDLLETLRELARKRAALATVSAGVSEARAAFDLTIADELASQSFLRTEVAALEDEVRAMTITAVVCGEEIPKGASVRRESQLVITDRAKLMDWCRERKLCISEVIDEDALLKLLKSNAVACDYATVDLIPKATIAKDLTSLLSEN